MLLQRYLRLCAICLLTTVPLLVGCSETAHSHLPELTATKPLVTSAGRLVGLKLDGTQEVDLTQPITIESGATRDLTGEIHIEGEAADGIMMTWNTRPGEILEQPLSSSGRLGDPSRHVMAFLREGGVDQSQLKWDIQSIWVDVKPVVQPQSTTTTNTPGPVRFNFRHALKGPDKKGTYVLEISVVEMSPPGLVDGQPRRPGPPTERPIYRQEVIVQ